MTYEPRTAWKENAVTKYVNIEDRVWDVADVVGHKMERCMLWNDGTVSARLVKQPKGVDLGFHRHETWLQIYVLSGKFRVMPDNKIIEAGGCYFVEAGDTHSERAEEDSLLLIVREEPYAEPTPV